MLPPYIYWEVYGCDRDASYGKVAPKAPLAQRLVRVMYTCYSSGWKVFHILKASEWEASIYLNLGGYLFCSLSKEAITNGDRTCVKSSCFGIRQPIRTAFAWADFIHWHPQTHQFKQYPSTWAVWCQDIQAWELCYHIDIGIAMLDDTRSEPSKKWVTWCMI